MTKDEIRYMIAKEVDSQLKISNYETLAYTSNEIGVSGTLYGKSEIIISLTTHGKRIYDVPIVIESLFRQTVKANKIILWLAQDEFSERTIPVVLKKMCERGLEIKFYEDIKSYKKLIPTLLLYPTATIITVDDDVIYTRDIIERFVYTHLLDPDTILFGRGHRMTFFDDGVVRPYNEWIHDIKKEDASILNFATGVGGILYPPDSLNSDVTNSELFMQLAPTADDIWFKAMALLNATPTKKIHIPVNFGKYCTIIERSQDISLNYNNLYRESNDKQINSVFNYYRLWRLIF